jgi:GAF domain-containing protein
MMSPTDANERKDPQAFRSQYALRAGVYLYSPAFQQVVSSLSSILPGMAVWYVSEDGERIEFGDLQQSGIPSDADRIHLCEHTHAILEDAAHKTGTKGDVVVTRCSHRRAVAAILVRLRNAPAGYLGMCGPADMDPELIRAAADILQAHVDLFVVLLAEHDDIELVQEVWETMTSSMKLEDMLDVALVQVLTSLGLTQGTLILWDEVGRGIVRTTRGTEAGKAEPPPLSYSFSDYRKSLDPKVGGIQTVPPGNVLSDWAASAFAFDPEHGPLCAIPFAHAETILGFALVVGLPGIADEYEKRLVLRTLLGGISAMIYALLNTEEVRERRLAQRTLHALFRSAGYWESKTGLLQMACELTVRSVQAEKGSIMLLDSSEKYLEPAAAVGLTEGEVGSARLPAGEGLPGYVVESADQVQCSPEDDPLSVCTPRNAYPDRYYVGLPLSHDEVFGVITLSSNAGPFEGPERDLLKSLSEALGVLVENALLREKQRRLNLDILRRLTNSLETRNPDTGGKTSRRTDLAIRVAQKLELPIAEIDDIEYASLLVTTSLADVSGSTAEQPKPRPPMELSRRIAECMRPSEKVLQIIRHLEEHFDGSGKPDGLAAERIPLGSRIIACVDVFVSSLTPENPWQAALENVQVGSGTRFDPRVLAALAELVPTVVAEIGDLGRAAISVER